MTLLWKFLKEEEGQDLTEYSLLMAFVALTSAALFLGAARVSRASARPPTASSLRPTATSAAVRPPTA